MVDINAEPELLGLSGSPTKVKTIENVVLLQKKLKFSLPVTVTSRS